MTATTTYLGLRLSHPIVCGASPLTADLDMVQRLEEAGAAAIVMHSLFEEQILKGALRRPRLARESRTRTMSAYAPIGAYARFADEYLEHLLRVKARVSLPVIASINGTTSDAWLRYVRALQLAGADALEVNFYNVARDPAESGDAIEQRLIDIVAVAKESIAMPVAVKLSPSYTSLPHLAARLERIGVNGLVLFNRCYLPDIDSETGAAVRHVRLSDSSELLPRLHAVAGVARFTKMSLALSGGVHEGTDVVKAVMAGADAVQITSALLRHGPSRLAFLRAEFEDWLERHRYESVAQLKGAADLTRALRPGSIERSDYLSVLQSWSPHPLNH
jgi:dihydroorotate dehydrogenase (fumarate)